MQEDPKAEIMEAFSESDIVTYVKENIIPVDYSVYGPGYRASVYLKDGTYLPCVVFRSKCMPQ
jgi:hypothetical protein